MTRSAGESVLQNLKVYSTGYKFPPYKYDPEASPSTAVRLTWRRNGQPVASRRVLSPTLVRTTRSALKPPHLPYFMAAKATLDDTLGLSQSLKYCYSSVNHT